jgi:hypothetical protein
MKVILVLLCALALSQAFKFEAAKSFLGLTPVAKLDAHNLGFSDYTGAGITPDQKTDIINLINGASGFYGADVEQNIKYIKSNLDKNYGTDTESFFVWIQTTANVRFSWYVWVFGGAIAGLNSGVNIINPGWSYLIVKNIAPPTSADYAYFTTSSLSVGPGITSDVSSLIASTINQFEPEGTSCTCNDQSIVNIGGTLINYYNRAWNTVCDATGVTYAYVKTADGLWGSFKAKNCYYTLFVNQ